jgi:hypothetical protein
MNSFIKFLIPPTVRCYAMPAMPCACVRFYVVHLSNSTSDDLHGNSCTCMSFKTGNSKMGAHTCKHIEGQLAEIFGHDVIKKNLETSSSEQFFDRIVDSMKLTLPTGEVLHDTAIIPGYCEALGINVKDLWDDVDKLENHSVDEAIQITDGHDPKWVPGKHPALNYRGNAIPRDKIWLQSDYDQGLKRYGYTGWQWKASGGTKRVESIPIVKKLFDKINVKHELKKQMNAFIITRYNSGQDCIGFHSDKTKDFAKDSVFVVIKLGQPRPFEFSWDEPRVASAKLALKKAEKEKGDADGLRKAKVNLKHAMKNRLYNEIFFSKELAAGTRSSWERQQTHGSSTEFLLSRKSII